MGEEVAANVLQLKEFPRRRPPRRPPTPTAVPAGGRSEWSFGPLFPTETPERPCVGRLVDPDGVARGQGPGRIAPRDRCAAPAARLARRFVAQRSPSTVEGTVRRGPRRAGAAM